MVLERVRSVAADLLLLAVGLLSIDARSETESPPVAPD